MKTSAPTSAPLLDVTAIPTGAQLLVQSQFGQHRMVKLGNDDFSGIPDRPIAYFTRAENGVSPEKFRASMRGEIGYVPGVTAIWQFMLENGTYELAYAPEPQA